ncbi:glycerol 3-phosphate dehydrogenase (NAD(P)+) [Motilibacter rhizosphaerae]|uniref:Glycerol-3-phosphate dehydrogenase [NAD(P)+] n=1 Tax=Motilibacter rhizosphaerae TaxID=598652 RepID=A0A4Q7NPW3_9ACTN|nr:NAD(P)H-dependent glycerol-3-phosphate dehydrogenase [Motilibacter rhizosphaerae]RZS87016.1 glycerol 3-phosphate dehydrogenase (NAD(P)+) [Motilibacter rhizosphaerae]
MTSSVAVLGAGSWGTAFSQVLADAGNDVRLWARRSSAAEEIRSSRQNAAYLPGIHLPEAVRATADAREALDGAEVVVLAVPSQTLRANLAAWAPDLPAGAAFLSLAKGIESGSCLRMSEVVTQSLAVAEERVAVLTGPNLAREIAERQPAAAVIGARDEEVGRRLQEVCATAYFRPYTNPDVVGCELGGAVKNVIALAVGMAVGMGLGDNAKASLVTRGLAETARLGAALGADPLTFAGLAGLGDLVATCFSPLSRNRSFGERLGRGVPLEETKALIHQTAEGVGSAESVLELARSHGVDMPITEQVVRVVREGASPREAVEAFMARSTKPER